MRCPSATTCAPVRVATSTIASGCSSLAATSASASTSRPSASVFSTSTVVPPRMRSTSFGRIAVPDGMFSARQSQPVTRTGTSSSRERDDRRRARPPRRPCRLHADHRRRRLQREPAGVERDALADEREVHGCPGGRVLEAHEPRAAARALTDAEDAAEAVGLELVLVPDPSTATPAASAVSTASSAKRLGGQVGRRRVHEVLRARHAGDDGAHAIEPTRSSSSVAVQGDRAVTGDFARPRGTR